MEITTENVARTHRHTPNQECWYVEIYIFALLASICHLLLCVCILCKCVIVFYFFYFYLNYVRLNCTLQLIIYIGNCKKRSEFMLETNEGETTKYYDTLQSVKQWPGSLENRIVFHRYRKCSLILNGGLVVCTRVICVVLQFIMLYMYCPQCLKNTQYRCFFLPSIQSKCSTLD